MEESSSPATKPSSRKNDLCQECKATQFRYQCPRCSFRSCSLACCKAHKERFECNGRRDRTAFVKLSQMSDQSVTSDFHFLEDVLRNVDTGKRVLKQTRAAGGSEFHQHNKRPRRMSLEDNDEANSAENAVPSHPLLNASRTQNLPVVPVTARHNNNWSHVAPRWRHVAKHALEQRQTKILFMPNGMQRRLHNQTHLKKDVLYWTIEWIFHSVGDAVTAEKPASVHITFDESTELRVALEHPQLQRHMLANGITVTTENVKFLIQQIPLKSYAVISPSSTLRDVLKDRTVIEFPTIEIVPPERIQDFSIDLQEVQSADTEDAIVQSSNG